MDSYQWEPYQGWTLKSVTEVKIVEKLKTVKEVKIVKEVKKVKEVKIVKKSENSLKVTWSDSSWRFACGDVFSCSSDLYLLI